MTQPVPNRESSSDPSQIHLTWRRIVAFGAVCSLLLFAGAVWLIWRPLTDAEPRLVGTWRNGTVVFSFHFDRTISAPPLAGVAPPPVGSWYIQGNKLYCPDSWFDETIQTILRQQIDDHSVLTFVDDNTIQVFTPINGDTSTWQRVQRGKGLHQQLREGQPAKTGIAEERLVTAVH